MKTGNGTILDPSPTSTPPPSMPNPTDTQRSKPLKGSTALAVPPRTTRPHFEAEADKRSRFIMTRPTVFQESEPLWRKYWWMWLLVTLLVIGLAVFLYFWLGSRPVAEPLQEEATPVTALTVGSNAALQSRTDLTLTFGVGGTLSQVLVKPGDNVTKGQTLALLDDRDLQSNLKIAQANITATQNELAKLKAGASDSEIKQAQQQLDQAKLQVDSLKSPRGTAPEIESARSQLASAQANLDQLRQGGSSTEKAKAQAAVSTAQANLTSAQTRLEKLQAGLIATDIAKAQAKVNQAQAELEKTRTDFYAQVTQAQISRDQGLIALNKAEEGYKAVYNQLHDAFGKVKPTVSQSELQQEASAYSEYQEALSKFNKLDSALNDLRSAQYNALLRAENVLSEAQTQLEKAKAGPTKLDIAEAETAVSQAQAKLDTARADLVKLTPSATDIAKAEAEVNMAQANLARLTGGAPTNEIASAQAEVQRRELALEALLKDPDSNTLAIQQAQLELRQGELERAMSQLALTTLKAPASGTLLRVNMVAGQVISAGTEVGQLVDTSDMSLQLTVSEAVGSKLQLNQPITLNFQPLPERSFSGKVSYISPKTQLNTGPGYMVTVSLEELQK